MFGKFKDQKEDHQSYSGENEEMSNQKWSQRVTLYVGPYKS